LTDSPEPQLTSKPPNGQSVRYSISTASKISE
jgi:hypothetical protein